MSAAWQSRLDRERRARKEAEQLLEGKSRELYVKISELETTKHHLESVAAQLTKALEAAAAASQAKSQFLATMSHELRTPLNAVIGFSEMIKNEAMGPVGSECYRGYAGFICDSGTHLLGLINDILDMSKLDAGHVELSEDVVDPKEAVASCLQLMGPQADKARVRLAVAFASEPPRLRADRRRLRQILLNLISNAVKFTPEGGEVRVSAAHDEAGLTLAVTDTGIGMAQDEIPIAFERFGQIDSTLARKYQGTGLGLPLTKHLVAMHGGTLTIASTVGIGTTVTIAFPAERMVSERAAA